jgi:hypothetical protein
VVGGRDGHQAEAADAAAGVPSCNMSPCIRTGLRRSFRRSEREAWPSGSRQQLRPVLDASGILARTVEGRAVQQQIIAQPPAIFKSLRLSRSALGSHVAEHFDLRDAPGQAPRVISLPGTNAKSRRALKCRGSLEVIGA